MRCEDKGQSIHVFRIPALWVHHEGITGVSFRRYKLASDSPGIETSLNVFTEFSSERRYRADFRFNIAWKIVNTISSIFLSTTVMIPVRQARMQTRITWS